MRDSMGADALRGAGRRREVTDYSGVGAVCRDCAIKAGYKPKDKVVGVWTDECGICHQQKPCTDMHNDWESPKERE